MTVSARQMLDEGWSEFSRIYRGASFSRMEDGVLIFADINGKRCELEPEDVEPAPTGLVEMAQGRVETAEDAALCRFLMGAEINTDKLRLLAEHAPVEVALAEYHAADIKRWLGSVGVTTKTQQRDQLVELARTAITPTEETDDERED